MWHFLSMVLVPHVMCFAELVAAPVCVCVSTFGACAQGVALVATPVCLWARVGPEPCC